RMKRCFRLLLPLLSGLTIAVFGQDDSLTEYKSLEIQAQSLLDRLNAHEASLAELFSRRAAAEARLGIPSPRSFPPVSPNPPKTRPIPRDQLPAPSNDFPETSSPKPAPTEILAPKLPVAIKSEGSLRSEGYYLGFMVAQVMPHSGGVRWDADPSPTNKMMKSKDLAFDNGYMVALLLGKDFGFVRAEAEHGMLHYDKARGRGFAEIHPTTLRVILDKKFIDRLDFRFGIGAGVDLAKIREEGKNYGRVSFCYDFLTGLGVRLNDGLALNLDYRFFLTAATDDYKRLQNHLLTAQFQFDL
ncbi:MAG: hypothetical protein VB997_08745, partial [Opitutales bacterium]